MDVHVFVAVISVSFWFTRMLIYDQPHYRVVEHFSRTVSTLHPLSVKRSAVTYEVLISIATNN